ncbi:YfcE family phosphodiesterase [Vibrio sp. V05_P4A8T149]|nr:YfcE family phosphodiesterase [Vibrio sp. V05_P4A8T149]OXX25583.1 YfcE family phosphodiesterase [Vibrio sp. V06_P1A73T115]OXX28888.1 YfcE family phosphodiesterase [Vibrio sp. V14_P6S14T42]OXX32182.1 YfcE family phosphodiesterase [Vibrio sp. V04_P4A5T148]OXX52977.1 YfcE family phosphodiesterase [Vibrio sp. V18_P1S4T112]
MLKFVQSVAPKYGDKSMKLFFASDLHGSLPATEKVLSLFEQSGADTLVLLGDLLNHGPRNPIPDGYNPTAVAECLNRWAPHIVAVRGNCDSEVDQMLLDFPMMMDFCWVVLESGTRFFLTHGHQYNAQNRPPLKKGDVLIHGHSHIPMAQGQGDVIIVNPGSATFPRNEFPPSYAIYTDGLFQVMGLEGQRLAQYRLATSS